MGTDIAAGSSHRPILIVAPAATPPQIRPSRQTGQSDTWALLRLTMITIYFTKVTQDMVVVIAARSAFCVFSSNVAHDHG
jgi:hypothetical protein